MVLPISSFDRPIFDKPFILSMGPQRAGTSWLDQYLRARGDVCLPAKVKEIFFFDRHYSRGSEFYHSHFIPTAAHSHVMEVSTTAFDDPSAPRRVFDMFGANLQLLCPLRHPVRRSYSLYQHYKRYGIVTGSLREACAAYPQIIESSRYATHLKRWFDVFGVEAVCLMFQEDLHRSQDDYVVEVCEVLGLPYMRVPSRVAGACNVSSAAPVPFIARQANRAADFLRQRRLYGVVNLGKALGLKRLVFGGARQGEVNAVQREDDMAWLSEVLDGEIEALETLVGPIEAWHDF